MFAGEGILFLKQFKVTYFQEELLKLVPNNYFKQYEFINNCFLRSPWAVLQKCKESHTL
jgi:hypothetical protein